MTTVTTDKAPTSMEQWAGTVLVAALAGIALGALDYAAQRIVPYPWADLANSPAVWAVAAFVLARRLGSTVARGAVAGVVLLAVAVEAYYLTATIVQHDDLVAPENEVWLVLAVLAGVAFGWGGAASRRRSVALASVGTALPVLVLAGEAARRLLGSESGRVDVALAEVVLAALVVAYVCARRRAFRAA